MSTQRYLIDTNIIIGLEDDRPVHPAFAALVSIAARHRVGIFVHEAARDDISRDRDATRRAISLSKLQKFQSLARVRGLTAQALEADYGPLPKPNDVVDATLLHALEAGAVDFLVTQDKGLHIRARQRSAELSRRVLEVADAVELLRTTFEPKDTPVRYVEEISAHAIPLSDAIFESLRADYGGFDQWWQEKCVREHRPCWIVEDGGLAGIVVRKEESLASTDASLPGERILKICTFKVCPEKRGTKLGELLLKKVLWFAQDNGYDVVYLTTFPTQHSLINLIEYYGFKHTQTTSDGELVYEKSFSRDALLYPADGDVFRTVQLNYPRFVTDGPVCGFGIPIKEAYHDVLFPDLRDTRQQELFPVGRVGTGPRTPGNTIRKVYLCRAASNLGPPGSLLFFYKGCSKCPPTQAITALGVLEEVALANSTNRLVHLVGGRSVYSESELIDWNASPERPVKVINFLLNRYLSPPIHLKQLQEEKIFRTNPPQSIFRLSRTALEFLIQSNTRR